MMELSQKLEWLIETAVEKEEIAGANIVVIRDGQEMAFAAGGYADIEAGKKYERDTIARLYSMTKPVTSAAAMLLMERGLLDPGGRIFAGISQCDRGIRRKTCADGPAGEDL